MSGIEGGIRIFVIAFLFYVSGCRAKISVILTPENETVFTTQERPLSPHSAIEWFAPFEGSLVLSDPLDACNTVKPPPTSPTVANSTERYWILIATWDADGDDCDLFAKTKNAHKAGYRAVIFQNLLSNGTDVASISSPEYDKPSAPAEIYACVVGYNDGKSLRDRFLSQRYLVLVEIEVLNTWIGYLVAGVLVVLAVLLLIGFGYVMVQMLFIILLWLREVIVHTIQERRRNRRRRLPACLLKRLPIQKWTSDIPQDTCSICLETFTDQDKVRVLPCSHVFHMACIDPWLLNQRRKCPNCKRKITFPDEEHDDSDSSTEDERSPLLRPTSGSPLRRSQSLPNLDEEENERQHLRVRLQAIHQILQEVVILANAASRSNSVENEGLEQSERNSISSSPGQESPSIASDEPEHSVSTLYQEPPDPQNPKNQPGIRCKNTTIVVPRSQIQIDLLASSSESERQLQETPEDINTSDDLEDNNNCHSCPEAEYGERFRPDDPGAGDMEDVVVMGSNQSRRDAETAVTNVKDVERI